jgi:hypothetical protein
LSIRRKKKEKRKLENERFEGYVNKTKMKRMDSRDDENVLSMLFMMMNINVDVEEQCD